MSFKVQKNRQKLPKIIESRQKISKSDIYLRKSDLLVLSSDYEGFGVVIAEALSVGVNVVSTDCQSGPREILNNGELGYLSKVDNPENLAKSMNKALDNPVNKDKLISRSKDFSLEIIGKKYQELIDSR